MIYSSVAHRRSSDKTLDSVLCNLDSFLEGINLKRLKTRTKKLVKKRRKVGTQTKLGSEELRNHFVTLEGICDGYQKTLIEALDKATSDAKQLSTHMWRIRKSYKKTGSLLQQMRDDMNDFASVSIDFETEPLTRDGVLPAKKMFANLNLQSHVTLEESVDGIVVEQDSGKDESTFEVSSGTVKSISEASLNVTVAAAAASAVTASGTESRDDGIAAVGIISIANTDNDDVTLNDVDCTYVEKTESLKNEYAIDYLTVQGDITSGSSIKGQVKDDKVAKKSTCECEYDDFDELPTDGGEAGSRHEEYFDTISVMGGSSCN